MRRRTKIQRLSAAPHSADTSVVQSLSRFNRDRFGKEWAHPTGSGGIAHERRSRPRMACPPMTRGEFDYSDVQGLVRFGYGAMKEASYALLRVKDAAAARSWLRTALNTA